MTEGSIAKNIIFFAIPLLWGNIFQQMYNVADTLIVGNYIGNEALAAVSSSSNLIFLMVGLFQGFGLGGGVLVARFFGAAAYNRLKRAMHTAIAFGLICGVVLTGMALVVAPQILRLIGTPPTVLPRSLTYFRIYFLGSVGFVMFNMQMGILQSLGDSRHPVMFLAAASVTNIALDLLFIRVLGFGVGGAAAATAISQFMSAVLCMRQLMRNPPECRLYLREIRLDKEMLGQILKNGIPAGLQNSLVAISNVFIQSNINKFGEMAMAGCGSYTRVEGFAFIPVMCFTQAIVTFVGQNLGAGKKDRAFKGAAAGTGFAMVFAAMIGVAVYFFAPILIGAFGGAPEAVAIGIRESHIAPLFFSLVAYSHCMAAVQRGAGRSFVPMLVLMICWCLARVVYISIAIRFIFKLEVVFWAYPITWSLSSIVFTIIFLRRKWLG